MYTFIFEKDYEAGPAQRQIIAATRDEIADLFNDKIDETAMVIFSTLRGFTLSLLKNAEKPAVEDRERYIDTFISLIMRGLKE